MSPEEVAAAWLDPATLDEPDAWYARLRREAPVAPVGDTGVHLVSTFGLVAEAVERDHDFSAALTGVMLTGDDGRPAIHEFPGVGEAGRVLPNADPPVHAAHRRAVQPALAAGRVAELAPWIAERAARRLEALVASGGGDFVAQVADPLPSEVTSRLLGFPEADLPRVQTWAMQGGEMLAGTVRPARMAALSAQAAELALYLAAHLAGLRRDAARRAALPVMDALLHAIDTGALSEAQAVGIGIVLVGAGGESTAGLAASAVRILAERPELQAELRAAPARIPDFVEEVVRLESPFRGHYRHVRRDTELGGVALPEGARLFLLWAAANRDPEEFEESDRLDLARPHPRHHLGFGRGIHFCVGAPLARLEVRLVLERLLARTAAFALDPGAPPERVPSVSVRRHARLPLRVEAAAGRSRGSTAA